jgi:hypothetical protein
MKTLRILTLACMGMMMSVLTFGQTVDELINKHLEAIGGKDNWKKITSMKMEANVNAQGMDVPIIIHQVHNKASKQEYTVMNMTGFQIVTTEGGWNFNPFQGQQKPEPMTDDEVKAAQEQLDIQGELLDYKDKGHTVELLGKEDVDGTECFKLKLTRKSGRESVYLIDPKTYYIIRTISKMKLNGQDIEQTINLSNYQKLPEGILIPFTMENGSAPAPINVTKVEVNPKIDDAVFKVSQ